MLQHTSENCAKLAERIVNAMDMSDLIRNAYDNLCDSFMNDKELFELEVENYGEEFLNDN